MTPYELWRTFTQQNTSRSVVFVLSSLYFDKYSTPRSNPLQPIMKRSTSLTLFLATLAAAPHLHADIVNVTALRHEYNSQDPTSGQLEYQVTNMSVSIKINNRAEAPFSGGTVRTPKGTVYNLRYVTEGSGSSAWWGCNQAFSSASALLAAWPSGIYAITLQKSAGGSTSFAIEIDVSSSPKPAAFKNVAALQAIDVTAPLVLQWSAPADVRSGDLVVTQVYADGTLAYNGFQSVNTALPASVTSYTIAANSLDADLGGGGDPVYDAELSIIRPSIIGTLAIQGQKEPAELLVGTQTETDMPIQVVGADLGIMNPLAPLPHMEDCWVPPLQTDVSDSFGWVCDRFYPYVYNASLDKLTNNGRLGGADGWMYLWPDEPLKMQRDGFFFYRYATGTWCWSNYYWSGWIYDYGNGTTHKAGWIDMTP